MTMQIRKAERSKRKARVGVLGPTGSGKTMSSLLLAKGFGGRTCLIDTENNSADLYAGHKLLKGFEYDVVTLSKPYSVERYIEAIEMIEQENYDTIIIDSASHAWAGPGGILEFVDKKTESQNKFVGWREATPRHNEFVERLTASPCHVIVTMRVKMEYVLEENDKGKKVPKKLGLSPVQRDGLEYEFDVVFDVATKSHDATSTKDRTSLFDGQIFKITDKTGAELMAWLKQGKDAPEPEPAQDPVKMLEKLVGSYELDFLDKGTLPALAAHFDEGQKKVRSFAGEFGGDIVKPFLDRLIASKDKRKAAIEKAAAAPAGDLLSQAGVEKIDVQDVGRLASFAINEGLTDDETLECLGLKDLADLPKADYAAATDKIIAKAREKKKLEKPARARAKAAA